MARLQQAGNTHAPPCFKRFAHVRMHACMAVVEVRGDFVTGIAAAGGDFRTYPRALVKACEDRSIQHSDG
jgi:hypothetical protein